MDSLSTWILNFLGMEEKYHAGKKMAAGGEFSDDSENEEIGTTKRKAQNYQFDSDEEQANQMSMETKKQMLVNFIQNLADEQVVDDLMRHIEESTDFDWTNAMKSTLRTKNENNNKFSGSKRAKSRKHAGSTYTAISDDTSSSDDNESPISDEAKSEEFVDGDRITRDSSSKPPDSPDEEHSQNMNRTLSSIQDVGEIEQLTARNLKAILEVYDVTISDFEKEALKRQVRQLWVREMSNSYTSDSYSKFRSKKIDSIKSKEEIGRLNIKTLKEILKEEGMEPGYTIAEKSELIKLVMPLWINRNAR